MQAILIELRRRDKTCTITFLINTEFLYSRKKGIAIFSTVQVMHSNNVSLSKSCWNSST
jgi:hypothetical protein